MGTTAGVLGYAVAPVAFIACLILIALGGSDGAADGSPSMTMLGFFGFAIVLALGLALLNAIGIGAWVDDTTGRFVRPESPGEWAVKIIGLVSGLFFCGAIGFLGVVMVLGLGGVDLGENIREVLAVVLIGGLLASVALAAIAGGIALLGWAGAVVGLVFGAGFIASVFGISQGISYLTILGIVSLGIAAGGYYAAGRMRGAVPSLLAIAASSGIFVVLGVAFLVIAAITGDARATLLGVLPLCAAAGYAVAGVLARREYAAVT